MSFCEASADLAKSSDFIRVCRRILSLQTPPHLKIECERLLYRVAGQLSEVLEFSYIHEVVVGLIQTDIEFVLLNHKNQLESVDATGRTPLHWAALHGNEYTLRALLCAKVNVDARELDGKTALQNAVSSRNQRCAELLLIAGADIHAKDQFNYQVLQYATQSATTKELVDLLLMAGADVNNRSTYGTSALMSACIEVSLDVIKALIAAGASVDDEDTDGDTALFYAIHGNNVAAIELLLCHGANSRHQNNHSHTVLHAMALWGNCDAIATFASRQLDLDADQKDNKGRTASDLLSERPTTPDGFQQAFDDLLDICRAQRATNNGLEPVELG